MIYQLNTHKAQHNRRTQHNTSIPAPRAGDERSQCVASEGKKEGEEEEEGGKPKHLFTSNRPIKGGRWGEERKRKIYSWIRTTLPVRSG